MSIHAMGRRAIAGWVIVAAMFAALPGCAAAAASSETVRRTAPGGHAAAVDLFLPGPDSGRGPAPLVVLSHGFSRTRRQHAANARHLADSGFVVAVPDDTRPAAIRDLVCWLADRAGDRRDSLHGRVDPRRIGLAGHSAGAASSVEAAVLLQDTTSPVRALCLLDGVPRASTWTAATRLRPVALATFRAEPSPCNANASLLPWLRKLPFPVQDVRVVGSTHCDQENPSDGFCGMICGPAKPSSQKTFRDLMTLFFLDELAPRARNKPSLPARITRLEKEGRLAVSTAGARP